MSLEQALVNGDWTRAFSRDAVCERWLIHGGL